MSKTKNIKQIRGFNYTDCYYMGEFNTHPSSGGLDPIPEVWHSAEQVEAELGVNLSRYSWKNNTVTNRGKLIESKKRFGQWRFEVTYE